MLSITQVPPLRVRPGDIADLARYFVRQAARRKGLPQANLTQEAIRHLESYTFPNNIKAGLRLSPILITPYEDSSCWVFLKIQRKAGPHLFSLGHLPRMPALLV